MSAYPAASRETTGTSYNGFHALVPIMIGLLIPVVGFAVFEPRALANAQFVLNLVMIAVLIVSATVFFLSMINPGETTAFSIDAQSRMMQIVRSGAFADTIEHVPFDRVSEVRMEKTFDDDGYESVRAIMVLKSGTWVDLPSGTRLADLQAVKSAMNLR